MSLYGALFAGVSGLKSQGTNMGVISDNISNLNTTGYKSTTTNFETLVVNSSTSSVGYSPGGALATTRQNVDQQGLLSATDSPTDIAISGNGFFVVNRADDSSGDVLYTRAGSFRQDAQGNFVNAAGFYLQGWPLDRDGLLPGQPGNLNTTAFSTLASLQTVNVENTNGVAAATTTVEIGANLDATEEVYQGPGSFVEFRGPFNTGLAALDVIVPEATALPAPASGFALGDQITIATSGGLNYIFEYGGLQDSGTISTSTIQVTGAGNVISTSSQTFFAAGTAPTGADAEFTIATATLGTITFTYKQSSPNPLSGEFNSMQSLANAINETNGLSARIVNDQLWVAPDDANEAMTFTDSGVTTWVADIFGAGTGTSQPIVSGGGTAAAVGVERFASLQGLADKVNASSGLTAVIESPLADTTLELRSDDPLGTVTFTDNTLPAGDYNLLREFGLITNVLPITTENTFGPSYDAATAAINMTTGGVVPQFSRNIRIFDALGTGHNLTMSFLKVATNTWAVEIYAADAGDISTPLAFDQIASGTVVFNGDGTLRSVSSGLRLPIDIIWTNGAVPSSVTFEWGTAGQPAGTTGATVIGLADGLGQFASDYNVAFVDQNGAEVGSLIGVSIDEDGFVIANYSNGESLNIFKLPIADFANPNGLASRSGNVWEETQRAGEVNLREAKSSGVGEVVSGVLEASNVELAEQLTDMIVTQRAYQANAKVISTTDELLEELSRL